MYCGASYTTVSSKLLCILHHMPCFQDLGSFSKLFLSFQSVQWELFVNRFIYLTYWKNSYSFNEIFVSFLITTSTNYHICYCCKCASLIDITHILIIILKFDQQNEHDVFFKTTWNRAIKTSRLIADNSEAVMMCCQTFHLIRATKTIVFWATSVTSEVKVWENSSQPINVPSGDTWTMVT